MKSTKGAGIIEVWRPGDLNGVELRRGTAVAHPVPRHWHDEYQLCLIQSGPGELTYRGSNHLTPPSSLFIVHPGEVHSNRCHIESGCSYRTIFVSPELMQRAAAEATRENSNLPFFPAPVVFDENLLRQYLHFHLVLELPASSLESQVLLLDLLAVLVLQFASERPARQPFGRERKAVARARDYLVEHYAENVSLESLARVAELSPYHFSRVFADQLGMPPHAFQNQLRVSHAKTLLREGWSISQVAAQTGFADQSHLTRHFKRLAGVTPGQYRSGSKNVQDSAVSPR